MWVTLIYTQEHTHTHTTLFIPSVSSLYSALNSSDIHMHSTVAYNVTQLHTYTSILLYNPWTFIQMAIITSDLHHAYLQCAKASNHRNAFTPCRNLQPPHANQQLFPGLYAHVLGLVTVLSSYQASDMDTAAQRLVSTSVEPEMHPWAISSWCLKQISHCIFSPHAARRDAGEVTGGRDRKGIRWLKLLPVGRGLSVGLVLLCLAQKPLPCSRAWRGLCSRRGGTQRSPLAQPRV